MKNTSKFSIIILLSALSLSISTAFCSVYGFIKIFAGYPIIICIICSCLEISKVIIAATLQRYWVQLNLLKRIYLFSSLLILIIITSVGIYGFLSAAYQSTANLDTITSSKISSLEYRKNKYEVQLNDLLSEKKILDNNYADLTKSFNNSISTPTISDKNKAYINTINSKNINKQINTISSRKETISDKINILTDSVNNIDLQIINFKSNNNSGELTSLKYMAKLTGYPMENIVNIFILLIIFVFDPLALILVSIANDKLLFQEKIEETENMEIPNSVDETIKTYLKKKKINKSNNITTPEINITTSPSSSISTPKPDPNPRQIKAMSHQEIENYTKKV